MLNSMVETNTDEIHTLVYFGAGEGADNAEGWETMSDALFGGNSECTFEIVTDPALTEEEQDAADEKRMLAAAAADDGVEYRVPSADNPVREVYKEEDERPLRLRQLADMAKAKEDNEVAKKQIKVVRKLPKVKAPNQPDPTPPTRRAVFSGHTSLEVNNDDLENTGFCGARFEIPWYMQEITNHEVFVLRVKSDGRQYKLNLQNDSFIPDDLYQGMINIEPGVWKTIKLELQNFGLTSRGVLKPDQRAFDSNTLTSIGFGIDDGKEGPFRLEIEWAICAYDLETAVPM